MRWIAIAPFFLAICFTSSAVIAPWMENPWYWSFRGTPTLLLGASDDDNLFQWPEADLIQHLDRIQAAGVNVIRNTMSDRSDRGWEVYPFRAVKSGRYDLDQWNPEYWRRFERLLCETARRGIVVQIEIWDRFDYTDNRGADRWKRHPYNPDNNVNYTFDESAFSAHYPDHPHKNKQPFFFTTPDQQNNIVVLKYQQAFVSKLLDHSLQYAHVLYCMDNETSGEPAWGRYWAEFIKARAAKEGRSVYVTEMWDDWDLMGEEHRRTFDHPNLYDFVDVSQNNHNKREKHWNNFLFVRDYLSGNPRPMNTTKTYGADGNKFGHSDQDAIERFWRHILAGAASARFHRPPAGLGASIKALACVRAARSIHHRVAFWDVEPALELLSDRDENEAYLAANPGHAYILYFTNGGSVSVDLRPSGGSYVLEWTPIDIDQNEAPRQVITAKEARIAAPSGGNWAATLVRQTLESR